MCALCLPKVYDPDAGTGSSAPSLVEPDFEPKILDLPADESKLPRCIAYLSKAGDVITLELTGEPKFTEADVELVATALSKFRKAA
ncbi:MAG TPA: hypothetical protein VG295_02045 [Solirubrobacteraceae bacterium]|nr:hypothetical protein [Solirubrobacteraceae bacterium]